MPTAKGEAARVAPRTAPTLSPSPTVTKNRSVAHSGTNRAVSSTVSRPRKRARLVEAAWDALAWVAFTVVIAAALCFFCLIAQALAAVAP